MTNVVIKDDNTLAVHGVLDDDIYSLEIDVAIQISDFKIIALDGKWHRYTTPDCPRAIPLLQDVIGFRIDDEGFNQAVHKSIGRKACRHYANLLIECCDSAKEAALIHKWKNVRKRHPDLRFADFINGEKSESAISRKDASIRAKGERRLDEKISTPKETGSDVPGTKRSSGFTIDLHVHTYPASRCSSASEDDLIQEAKRIGLDAICFTDHNFVWDPERITALQNKHRFLILRGNEITTDQGDMLVFGFDEDVQGIISIELLRQKVMAANGFMIAAHPFRGFLTFDAAYVGMTPQKAMQRALFKQVDALEVLNGKVTPKENQFARQVAEGLNLPATGGSDAHEVFEVGQYATRFSRPIQNETELVEALKSDHYMAIAYRKENGFD
ncbi:MAG: PHP domain-containing protein [Desulfobacterales bacterium]|jgi:predicted metal-dependent phosphoesterase TrpH